MRLRRNVLVLSARAALISENSMKFTVLTRNALWTRRERRKLSREGWEEVGESGGRLWELHRGYRIGHVITDVRIGPEGRTLFIKTADTVRPVGQTPGASRKL